VCAHTIFPKQSPEKIVFRFPHTDEEIFRFSPHILKGSVRWDLQVKRNDLVDARILKVLAALVSQNITFRELLTFRGAHIVTNTGIETAKWALGSIIALIILAKTLA